MAKDHKMPYITDTELLARQEGQRQGQREGELQRAREDVIDALEARFGEVPYPVREAVNRVGSGKELKRLHRLAVTVRSLDAFSV